MQVGDVGVWSAPEGAGAPSPVPGPVVLDERYELVGLLGSGGMARVHRGLDLLLRRPVAVKVFHPHLLDDPATVARARGETRVLARLDHPHLVRLFDASFPDALDAARPPYIVMELVDGPTLSDAVRDHPMAPQQAATLGAGLADALAHVHAAGVVHRDVKPANVLLDAAGTPKLADFGIALLGEAPRHTTTGMLVGTAGYLAPEQIRGAAVTGATDVHALGLVVLECLTGARAYPGTGVQAAVDRLQRRPELPATLPASWRELLTAITADDAALRPTAAAAAVALRSLAQDEPVTAAVPVLRPRPRRWAVPVAAALVVLGALGAVLWLRSGPESTPPPVTAGTPLVETSAPTTAPVAPVAASTAPAATAPVVVEAVAPETTVTPPPSAVPTTTAAEVAPVVVVPTTAAPTTTTAAPVAPTTTTAAPAATTTTAAGPGNGKGGGNGNGPGGSGLPGPGPG